MPGDSLQLDAPRAAQVKRLALQEGFMLVGIASAQASEHAAHVRQWLADGKHGEMDYLAKNVEQRLDPQQWLRGARSIICVAQSYEQSEPDTPSSKPSEQPDGRIARYAWQDDYHKTIGKSLARMTDALRAGWPEHQFKYAVDTAPLLEREHACHAGLGWVGKHTLLIHPKLGSYFHLGQIVTTLPLQTARDLPAGIVTDHCGSCTRCIDACPTHCITPYQIDASACISYLTIEHHRPIDLAFHKPIGEWLAGCDICQEVCPYNQRPRAACGLATSSSSSSSSNALSSNHHQPTFDLLGILNWDETGRRDALQGSPLKRIKLDQFKRNALIAAGNALREHPHPSLRRRIEELSTDEQEASLVRTTASQVLDALPPI